MLASTGEYVTHHARQLDVGRLRQLQETVAFRRLGLDEFAAIAQRLAESCGRHKALGDQPVADQIGDQGPQKPACAAIISTIMGSWPLLMIGFRPVSRPPPRRAAVMRA